MKSELWELHQRFHYEFREYLHNNDSFYLPSKWIPHCTLKSGVKEENLSDVFTYCINNYNYH